MDKMEIKDKRKTISSEQYEEIKCENQLIAVIADEETCTAFVLAGIGEKLIISDVNIPVYNYHIYNRGDENTNDLLHAFLMFHKHPKVAIILIQKHCVMHVRNEIKEREQILPVVLEIPSRDEPYNLADDIFFQHLMVLNYYKKQN